MKRWARLLLGSVVVLGGGLYLSADHIKLNINRWISEPAQPNRPVTLMQGPPQPPQGERPPNIILILADDLGFNDVTITGEGVAGTATPNIDAIGREGVVFSQGYAANATCAPSRAAMLTGRYATRFGYEFTPTDVRLPGWFPTSIIRPDAMFARNIASFDSDWSQKAVFDEAAARNLPPPGGKGMPASEITMAEQLQSRGYHTVHLGKWHLGEAKGMRPEDQGFAESLGFIIGGQMFLPEHHPQVVNSKQDFDPIDRYLWANLPWSVQYNGSPRFAPDRYMTDYISHHAVQAIRANRNRPFFLYVAYNAPHTPLQALKSDYDALGHIKDQRARVYAAMVRAVDRGVGQVMAELKAQGLDENTLVIFSSDNGGAHYVGLPDLNRPYRGWKATFYDGGTHVPFLMRWPARIAAGSRFNSPVSQLDLFATASAMAGAALPADRPIDGVDLMPFLSGEATGVPHRTLFWRSGGYRTVLHDGWKLHSLTHPAEDRLYDLGADPAEKADVAGREPARLAELKALLAAHDRRQAPPAWPSLIRSPIPLDRPLGVPPKSTDPYIYWWN
jgi:arylsulfatase A-like enzyme